MSPTEHGGPGPPRRRPMLLPVMLERKPLTARRAAVIIATYTLIVTLIGGTVEWLVDREDFHSLGAGIWWAVQTVTTVGYGDIVPRSGVGRAIGVVVMLSGIGFLTVITASVTASFIEVARRRLRRGADQEIVARLDEISSRLGALESRLPERPPRPE